VLDFGLAKLQEPPASDAVLTQSPTLLGRTQVNVILGTAAYMSPEQARGQAVDRASDIWAFGCVLYEMLTGTPTFTGETLADILGGVVRVDPDWSQLPDATPREVRSLLRRCLQKDRKRRLKDIGDASLEIEEGLGALAEPATRNGPTPTTPVSRKRERLPWIAAALLLLVATGSLPFALSHLREATPVAQPIRFVVLPPERATIVNNQPAISPDGKRLVFVATLDGRSQLWLRPIDLTTAQPLPGTDGADHPFWSPDGQFVAFFASGKLKKVAVSGGPPQTLCDAPAGRGGAWNQQGTIVFAPTVASGLARVSSSGGVATSLAPLASGKLSHRSPNFLPDGRHFLFFVQGETNKQGIYLGSLDTTDRKLLLPSTSSGAYASPGYVLFLNERTLMAQPFDANNLELTGEAVPVAEQVGAYNTFTSAFSTSTTGVLAYSAGLGERQVAWFDRLGRVVERIGSPLPVQDLALSPDGKRAAVQWAANDIWVVDLVRAGVPSRLTFTQSVEDLPVWSPDGSRILFNSTEGGNTDIYWKASSGAGNEEAIAKSGTVKRPTDWSHDGRFILYDNEESASRSDLWVLPITGDKKPIPFLRTPFAEQQGRMSPDGKWIAYISDESGREEVYVQTFPASGGKWQVSTSGGVTPRWRRDGRELFYLAPDRKIMSVEVRAGAAFEFSAAKPLFDAPIDIVASASANRYDVSADGQRFLIGAPAETTSPAPITVVVNWLAGLKNEGK
jgi:Tol biopolymer transport system component